ncbi:MAG: hypothetical protein ACREIA_17410 [Opitutaceae bacterium]
MRAGSLRRLGWFAAALCAWLGFAASVHAAPPSRTVPITGLREAAPRVHTLVGARIVVAPGKVIDRGTLVLRDGVVEAVGADVDPPPDARVWDLSGRILYAGFIESQSTLFLPKDWKPAPADADADESSAAPKPPDAPAGSRAWNPRVTPERSAARVLAADPKGAEALRALGFSVAHIAPARGVFRGQSALVSLGEGAFSQNVVRPEAAQQLVFEFGSSGKPAYPMSLMGSIALVRQTLLDARWFDEVHAVHAAATDARVERPEANASLGALGPAVRGDHLVVLEITNELDVERGLALGREFELELAFRGSRSNGSFPLRRSSISLKAAKSRRRSRSWAQAARPSATGGLTNSRCSTPSLTTARSCMRRACWFRSTPMTTASRAGSTPRPPRR